MVTEILDAEPVVGDTQTKETLWPPRIYNFMSSVAESKIEPARATTTLEKSAYLSQQIPREIPNLLARDKRTIPPQRQRQLRPTSLP